MANKEDLQGPRGGTTTRSKTGMIRFVVYLHPDERQAIWDAAHEKDDGVTMSDVVRQAIRNHLHIED